jgi:hypothetical protein
LHPPPRLAGTARTRPCRGERLERRRLRHPLHRPYRAGQLEVNISIQHRHHRFIANSVKPSCFPSFILRSLLFKRLDSFGPGYIIQSVLEYSDGFQPFVTFIAGNRQIRRVWKNATSVEEPRTAAFCRHVQVVTSPYGSATIERRFPPAHPSPRLDSSALEFLVTASGGLAPTAELDFPRARSSSHCGPPFNLPGSSSTS